MPSATKISKVACSVALAATQVSTITTVVVNILPITFPYRSADDGKNSLLGAIWNPSDACCAISPAARCLGRV